MLKKVRNILSSARNRESFFLVIASFFPATDWRYKLIEKAYNDAKDAFRGKFRDDGSERYFEHIRAVTLILILYLRVTDYKLIIAALLHDIVEDIPSWTIARVREEYGEDISAHVDALTKPAHLFDDKKECHEKYHQRFKNAKRVFFLIKLADRLHNLLTLWSCSKEKRLRKIIETELYYLPYAETHFILYHEILAAIDSLKEDKKPVKKKTAKKTKK